MPIIKRGDWIKTLKVGDWIRIRWYYPELLKQQPEFCAEVVESKQGFIKIEVLGKIPLFTKGTPYD